MLTKEFLKQIETLYSECFNIVVNKNADYGGKDKPFKNFMNSLSVGVDPRSAILVRVMDKISRISNLLDKEAEVQDEKISDTMKDAINYLAILHVLDKHMKEADTFNFNI